MRITRVVYFSIMYYAQQALGSYGRIFFFADTLSFLKANAGVLKTLAFGLCPLPPSQSITGILVRISLIF